MLGMPCDGGVRLDSALGSASLLRRSLVRAVHLRLVGLQVDPLVPAMGWLPASASETLD